MKKIIQIPNKHVGVPEPEPLPHPQHNRQVSIINELFLDNGVAKTEEHLLYKALILKKISNYKRQDASNHIFDPNWFITAEEVLELLVASRLQCYYCRSSCAIHYTEPRFGGQWTLDRLSNDQGHNRQNVVISCLKCNLHRGVKNSSRYKLGKQMKFTKIYTSTSNISSSYSDMTDE